MQKLLAIILSTLVFGVNSHAIFAQEKALISLRLYIQPQVSSLTPYDTQFLSLNPAVSPSFAFGIEASKNLSQHLELSFGLNYASQAGNYKLVFCDIVPNNLFFPSADRLIGSSNCPFPRGNQKLLKIPLSVGWRIIQKEKYMSRVSIGPQFQLSLDPSYSWLHQYNKFSLAGMLEWSNYFKLNRQISLVAGLRFDRGMTPMDNNYDERSIGTSMGLTLGAEYTLWAESK